MEGDSETCSWHGFFSHHSCLLAPALKELQTVGSMGEQGCVPNNGDGRRGGVFPQSRGSVEPEAFQGPLGRSAWAGDEGHSALKGAGGGD
jgi:hypothetical protein